MPVCISLLSLRGYLHWWDLVGVGRQSLPKKQGAAKELLGNALLLQGRRAACATAVPNSAGNGGCDLQPPPRCCSSQTSAYVDLLPTTPLSAPVLVANPPAKGPKSRFDDQITKAMIKTTRKNPPTTKSKKIHIPLHIQKERIKFIS